MKHALGNVVMPHTNPWTDQQGPVTRWSTEKDDPGYQAWEDLMFQGVAIRVFFNGTERFDVSTADTKAGTVKVACLDEDGNIFAVGNEVATEILRGDVRVEFFDRT